MILFNRKAMGTFITQFVYVVLVTVEIVVFLRFILKFFGASDQAAFVRWLYSISYSLIYPFWGAFPSPEIEGKYLLEFSSIFAMLIYWLMAYLIISLIEIIEGKKDNPFIKKGR